jgi:phospholipid/cholesterol/gamma-HCH transport system permease protein
VGRAATEAFVYSFIAILFLDFTIGIVWNGVYKAIWPQTAGLL